MSAIDLMSLEEAGYQVLFLSHARAILEADFPEVLNDLNVVLRDAMIPIEEIIGSGGGETKGTQRLRRGLASKGWTKTNFEITKTINRVPRESISHEVDHVKSFPSPQGEVLQNVALEIEWNNKDPFFDRDLENFKRLHAEGAISVGVIITRGRSLQEEMQNIVRKWIEQKEIDDHAGLEAEGVTQTARQKREVLKRVTRSRNPISFRESWTSHFVSDKFGTATTHWAKLEDRIRRGVGNPCPLLLIGMPSSIVTFNEDPAVVADLLAEGAPERESRD